MTTEQETTFSVIVLAFPEDDGTLATSLGAAFGIGEEAAQAIIEGVPVRVKRAVDGATAKHLAGQLLGVGADLCIRNEQTGEERNYQASEIAARMSAPEAHAPSGEMESPVSAPTPSASEPGPASRPDAASSLLEALRHKRERSSSSADIPMPIFHAPSAPSPLANAPPSQRGSVPNPPPAMSLEEALFGSAPISQTGDAPMSTRASVPPPASLPTPHDGHPSLGAIDKCSCCGRVVEKGAKCLFCGWSNEAKKRFCRECGKEISLVSGLGLLLGIPFALLGVGAAVGLALQLDLVAGAAGGALVLGLAFVLDGARSHYRCVHCKRDADTSRLVPQEVRRLLIARVKWIGFGVIILLLGGGLTIPVAVKTTMYIDSYGIGWRVGLPRTHREFERKVNTVLTPDYGPARVIAQVATNARHSVHTYALMELVIPRDKPPKVDTAQLDQLMALAVGKLVGGAKLSPAEGHSHGGNSGRQAEVTGTFDGKPVTGKVRTFHFETHEIIVVAYLASAPDIGGTGAAFLDSLTVEKQKKAH